MFKDYEVWIIDGQSKKEVQDFLTTLKAPFFWISEKDLGIYDAMNKGVKKSKGNWLYFLGSGDKLNNKLVLQEVFSKQYNSNVSLLSGKIIYQGETQPFIYSSKKRIKTPSWNRFFWIRNGLHHQGTFYKKQIFNNKKYSLEYPTFSDYCFNLNLYKNKINCFLLNDLIATCNSDGISKTGNWKNYKEEIKFKTELSSIMFKPVFYVLVAAKFFLRKLK